MSQVQFAIYVKSSLISDTLKAKKERVHPKALKTHLGEY